MRPQNFAAIIFVALISFSFTTSAVVINVVPNSLSVELGNAIGIDITVSDLGDGIAPSLSISDLDFIYDASILSFNNATFGNQLDLFGLGNLQQVDSSTAGTVNLFELTFDLPSDLNTLQAPGFVLAHLAFDTLAVGSTSLSITSNSFGDSFGDALSPGIVNSFLTVNEVTIIPIPAALWLMLSGIACLGGYLRCQWRSKSASILAT